jgi:hypothetical protein
MIPAPLQREMSTRVGPTVVETPGRHSTYSAPALRNGALEPRDATEEPERDPVDLDPFTPRLERMSELVQKQERKKRNAATIPIAT